MGLRLQRFLGPPMHMTAGQWTDRTASGRPAIACPGCGGISELEPPHEIFGAGIVKYVWSCPMPPCPIMEFISLGSYSDEDGPR